MTIAPTMEKPNTYCANPIQNAIAATQNAQTAINRKGCCVDERSERTRAVIVAFRLMVVSNTMLIWHCSEGTEVTDVTLKVALA